MIDKIIEGTEKQITTNPDEIDQLYTNLGTIEPTNIAAQTHLANTYFINSTGQLVKATVDIAVNDSIIIGTNCKATNICDIIATVNNTINYNARKPLSNLISLESLSQFDAQHPFDLNEWRSYNYTSGYSRIIVDYARSAYTTNHPFGSSAFAATFILLDYWCIQIACFYNNPTIYIRTMYNNTPSNWYRFQFYS